MRRKSQSRNGKEAPTAEEKEWLAADERAMQAAAEFLEKPRTIKRGPFTDTEAADRREQRIDHLRPGQVVQYQHEFDCALPNRRVPTDAHPLAISPIANS